MCIRFSKLTNLFSITSHVLKQNFRHVGGMWWKLILYFLSHASGMWWKFARLFLRQRLSWCYLFQSHEWMLQIQFYGILIRKGYTMCVVATSLLVIFLSQILHLATTLKVFSRVCCTVIFPEKFRFLCGRSS